MMKNIHAEKVNNWILDLFLILVVSFVLSILYYHPYYFGDELTAFFWHGQGKTFANIFDGLNSYKPRLVFNALWALYGYVDAPRYVPMVVNAGCMGGSAALLYLIARRKLDASRFMSLLVAAILLTSRFGAMLYFDYLSGNIETLSLLLFLAAVYLMLDFLGEEAENPSRLFWVVVLSCLMILVHERYIAASFVMGCLLVARALTTKRMRLTLAVSGVITAILPILVFLVAGRMYSSMPITTGTAGRPITINVETVSDFVTYLSNVFLGTNFGYPWFVGTLNLHAQPGAYVIPAIAILLGCLWIIMLFKTRLKRSTWLQLAMMFGLVIAMIAVAALPGPEKQEARWMFPVSGLIGLLIVAMNKRLIANVLLTVFLCVNIIYFATGSYKGIFNVQSASAADRLGAAFQKVPRTEDPGIILDAPEPQTSWWLGGDTVLGNDASSGIVFCRANFGIDGACIYPPTALDNGIKRFGFGLKFLPGSNPSNPSFTYVNKADLSVYESIAQAVNAKYRTKSAASLELTPASVDVCKRPLERINVRVRWNVKNPSVHLVTIWLVANDGTPRIFAEGGPSGTADTGKWVASEISFVLMNRRTNYVLATTTLRAKTCSTH